VNTDSFISLYNEVNRGNMLQQQRQPTYNICGAFA